MNTGAKTPDDGRWERPLRSKGLLPALGVGGVVYLVTGAVSLGTLAMVGIGAGVGYGVGNWLSEQYEKKKSTGWWQRSRPGPKRRRARCLAGLIDAMASL